MSPCPTSSQGERHRSKTVTAPCVEDARRMWDNSGTKGFLLWLSIDVNEKNARNEVLSFPQKPFPMTSLES